MPSSGETTRSRDQLLRHEMREAESFFNSAYNHAAGAFERAAQNVVRGNPGCLSGFVCTIGHAHFLDKHGNRVDVFSTPLSTKAKKEIQYFSDKYDYPFANMFGLRYRKMTARFDESGKLVVLR